MHRNGTVSKRVRVDPLASSLALSLSSSSLAIDHGTPEEGSPA